MMEDHRKLKPETNIRSRRIVLMGNNINFHPLNDDEWLTQGKSVGEHSLEPEYFLGNLVKLNEPYRQYDHGIIVEHIGYNAEGSPHVSLHLYNTRGEIHVMKEGLQTPHYVDFAATEFEVIRVANTR